MKETTGEALQWKRAHEFGRLVQMVVGKAEDERMLEGITGIR